MSIAHSTETFRTIQGLTGYRFGDQGTVQSCKVGGQRGKFSDCWHNLTRVKFSNGYLVVKLVDDNHVPKFWSVHRLVLEAFVGPCPDGMECRHLDGNPSNDCLSNLAWGTKVENAADRERHGRSFRPKGEIHHLAKLTEIDIIAIRQRSKNGELPKCICLDYGVTRSCIERIVDGRGWKHVPFP